MHLPKLQLILVCDFFFFFGYVEEKQKKRKRSKKQRKRKEETYYSLSLGRSWKESGHFCRRAHKSFDGYDDVIMTNDDEMGRYDGERYSCITFPLLFGFLVTFYLFFFFYALLGYKLINQHKVEAIAVVKEGKLVGALSAKELRGREKKTEPSSLLLLFFSSFLAHSDHLV